MFANLLRSRRAPSFPTGNSRFARRVPLEDRHDRRSAPRSAPDRVARRRRLAAQGEVRRQNEPCSFPTALLAAAALALLWGSPARAGGPTVVELFTSQSCYSCPPAEALLGELAPRENLIALEFHVDYWDDLVYGSAGRWKDLFSDPAFTARQRRYAARIRNGGVYTPQAVIDGVVHTVGSRRGRVLRLIERSARTVKPVRVSVEPAPGGGFTVTLESRAGRPSAAVLLARYDLRHVTPVEAGENKGKTLTNHHVVRELREVGQVGRWTGKPAEIPLADLRLGPNQGCAVIVQAHEQGAILGAAACPS